MINPGKQGEENYKSKSKKAKSKSWKKALGVRRKA